jgi:glycosyltransferase involved in cell wall biosynthesis
VRVAFVDSPLHEYRLPFLHAMRDRIDSLHVFVTRLEFDLSESQLRSSGLDLSLLRSPTINHSARLPFALSEPQPLDIPWNLLSMLFQFGPDAIISGEMGLRTLEATLYRLLHPNCRLVIWARLTEHTESARGTIRKVVRKAIVRHSDAIITNGSSGRRYLLGIGAEPSQVHVVHQASALKPEQSTRLLTRPLRLLFVGRLITLKGLHLLLPVLDRYKPGTWTLTVAGDGPEYGALQAFASQHDLPVDFVGFVPRAKLPGLFADHDVFVFPTLKDEWGLVVGEALRAGLPVVGSIYSDAVCEIIEDGVTGWMMRPDSEDSIRAALDRAFATTPAELKQARGLARDSVRDLTPDLMAQRFLSVLQGCTQQHLDGSAGCALT